MVLAVSQSKMEVEFGISLIIPAITALPTLVGLTAKWVGVHAEPSGEE